MSKTSVTEEKKQQVRIDHVVDDLTHAVIEAWRNNRYYSQLTEAEIDSVNDALREIFKDKI